jgi:hypothetical protein
MRFFAHISPLLLAALFLTAGQSRLYAQGDLGQQEGSGIGDIQEHSVRGDITAISGDTITLKTDEGEIWKVETSPNTRFRKQRDQIKITDLKVGDMIAAIGDKDTKAKNLGAVMVFYIDRQQYAQARADFGKTWTAGVVQSINGTNIVIKRIDKVTQTIAVDENTSFRQRREDITLADIKPGDTINARGTIQNGTFLATVINLGHGGGFGPGGNGAGTGAHHAPDSNPSQSNN